MAIFTGLAIAAAIGIEAGFVTSAIAFGLNAAVGIAASMGLSYAAKALAGNQAQSDASAADHFSAQGTLQAAGDVPRSFNIGYSSTAGSLVYANTWGNDGETPNAYFTQVIALADLPGGSLVEVWINGELVTLASSGPNDTDPALYLQATIAALSAGLSLSSPEFTAFCNNYIATHGGSVGAAIPPWGNPVLEYRKDGKDHLWVKYYDGTQGAADAFLSTQVASAERPYSGTTRVGYGIAYVICTALVDDTLFTGFPTYKFAVSGIPLYDISKDSSVGGSGSHRWSDPSTWGGDGDNLPAVQIYNLLRGISYNGEWLYGLQSMTAPRLPATNWIYQIGKCRAPILGESGNEQTYRSGGQINVNAQPANAIEALLTACQGRLSEIGGFYKVHLGAPDEPEGGASFTDADILSSEEQNFTPFFGLSDSINGITASYPFPAEGWATKAAPPLLRDDLEARDGSRRLLANPQFDFVPYSAQVQRLMRSALDEAQRARRHTIVLPPAFWPLEPGGTIAWSSVRNGYESKLFRVDGLVDKSNLDVILNITEVDPSDYDWDHTVDFRGVAPGPTVFPRPSPQGINDWFAEPWIIRDDEGVSRRPAIRLSWDGDMPGVSGVAFAVRNKSDQVVVHRGRTDYLAAGAIIISQNLLPDFEYQAQGQYIPGSPRDVIPSDWLDVTTPDVTLGMVDVAEGIRYNINALEAVRDEIREIDARISDAIAQVSARQSINKNVLNTQSWDHRVDLISRIEVGDDANGASIEDVRTVANNTQTAFAGYQVTINAHLDTLDATVSTNASALSTLNSSFASYSITTNASIGALSTSVNTNSSSIATLDGLVASKYSVTLNAGNAISGLSLINGGPGLSTFNVAADKIQFTSASVNGGAPVNFLTLGTINGVPSMGMTGNWYLDGTFNVNAINAGEIQGVKIAATTITAGHMAANSITAANGAIENLSVQSLKIGDNAVTVPMYETRSDAISTGLAVPRAVVSSLAMSIDTTGLGGKVISILVSFSALTFYDPSIGIGSVRLIVNGSVLLETNSGTQPPFLTFVSSYQFVATGGVASISVSVDWQSTGGSLNLAYMGSRTLSAVAAKR